jgi:hypothetical protein
MKIESNVVFDCRYNSILFDLKENLKKKKLKTVDSTKGKIYKKRSQIILPVISEILVDPPFQDWPKSQWQYLLQLPRFSIEIESYVESNQYQ